MTHLNELYSLRAEQEVFPSCLIGTIKNARAGAQPGAGQGASPASGLCRHGNGRTGGLLLS